MMKYLSELCCWYFSRKTLPYWCIFIIDCIITFLSALTIYAINNGLIHTSTIFWPLCGTLAFYLVFYMIGFRIFRTYSGILRYSSFVDLQRICVATVFGMVATALIDYFAGPKSMLVPLRLRDIFSWTMMATFLMWAIRVMIKYCYDTMYKQKDAQRAFIYGVKQGGVSIAKSLRNQDPAKYIVSGFVSDDPNVVGIKMMGVNVFALDDRLVETMKKDNIKAIFVSPLRSESLREKTDFVNALVSAGIKIFMMPDEMEWDGKSDIKHQMFREIEIEDLLQRDKIEIDMAAIGKQLQGKRILITGAAGSIGSEIVRQVSIYKPEKLILIDQAETPLHDIRLMMMRQYPGIDALTIVSDIANRVRMETIFDHYRPEYVFHAAAYKHVPMMEDNPAESIQNNVEGTRIIADLAVKYGTGKFVMISTDKAVNPTNVMGASKRICEIYVQSLDKAIKEGKIKGQTQFVTTRFGNVLGSNGSVIPLFKEQIRNGGPITVTHPDIIRYFMLIPEACKLVLEAGTMGKGGEIFVFDMGKPVKIVDLAKQMIKLSGADIEIKFTGLRDGEKLYEEVLNEKETTLPTFNPKIKIAKVREYIYEEVNSCLDELYSTSFHETDMQIVARMKRIVPEFRSQHSKYEALDKETAIPNGGGMAHSLRECD